MLSDIPAELRALRQWIVWRAEPRPSGKPTKIPYTLNGYPASVIDPSHWADFESAVAVASSGVAHGIGFVFTADDPYCGIDLDKTDDAALFAVQREISETFATYQEHSPNGGLHVICKASVPNGVRFGSVEVYSDLRYFTFTGDVYKAQATADCQELTTRLWESIRAQQHRQEWTTAVAGDPERASDADIYNEAAASDNGSRFVALWNGDWSSQIDARTQTPYPSASEADFALVNMLQFHSRNRIQIERMYLASPAGEALVKRKTHPAYLIKRMIDRSFDNEPPPFDYQKQQDAIHRAIAEEMRNKIVPVPGPIEDKEEGYSVAPDAGVLSNMMQFFYDRAYRQVPEIAVVGALGFFAGIVGSAYNVSGAGLNIYSMLVAKTGTGKEAMASGIDAVCNGYQRQFNIPILDKFRGPSEIASGQALNKAFKENSSLVCVLGEFGLRLKAMSDERAPAPQVSLQKYLLDIYGKSGRGSTLGAMAYSDTAKNVASIANPALTLICESSPDTLYPHLSEAMIGSGLLPRFIVVDYTGARTPTNYNASSIYPDPVNLLNPLGLVVSQAVRLMAEKNAHAVDLSHVFARHIEFDQECDARINGTNVNSKRELWSRAALHVLKIASLLAVGKDAHNPVILPHHYEWAQWVVRRSIKTVSIRFEKGDAGYAITDHQRRLSRFARLVLEFIENPLPKHLETRFITPKHQRNWLIAKRYLQQTCRGGVFNGTMYASPVKVLDAVIEEACGLGWFEPVNVGSPQYQANFETVDHKTIMYEIQANKISDIRANASM